MPKEVGDCYGFRPKYFYDEDTNECHFFYYSGCGGNQNKFDTKKFCEQLCVD